MTEQFKKILKIILYIATEVWSIIIWAITKKPMKMDYNALKSNPIGQKDI